jgi:flavin-dependent dehydrogenase
VFFTGNLAAEAHPIIAEGISMAIQSSVMLARLLVANGRPASEFREVSEAYQNAWLASFGFRVRAASVFARLAAKGWTRELGAPIFERFPALLTLGARHAGKAVALPQAIGTTGTTATLRALPMGQRRADHAQQGREEGSR